MRKILAALLCCWCSHALAQTAQELIDNPKNSENVTTFGMGYRLNQYSPLNQINKSNAKRLAKQPTIVNRGAPAHEGAGSPDPRRRALILNRRAPDRLAGGDIERSSPVAVHHVHNAVVDAGLR